MKLVEVTARAAARSGTQIFTRIRCIRRHRVGNECITILVPVHPKDLGLSVYSDRS